MIVQVVFNILIALFVYVFWVKLRKPPKDDPRLSRGLQLLQSKISVLEDLSDKTEVQVEQLNALMEKKIKQVQETLEEADAKMRLVEESIQRNKEVSKIFQEQIPHDEIVKRQNTIKYIKAAKMANSGSSVEEIVEVVDLPLSEIELIAKLNKDNLVFDDDSLPEWAKEETSVINEDDWQLADKDFRNPDLSNALTFEAKSYDSLQKLGEEFRKACTDYEAQQIEDEAPSQIAETAKVVKDKVTDIGGDLAESIVNKMQKSMDLISDNLDFQKNSHQPQEDKSKAEIDKNNEITINFETQDSIEEESTGNSDSADFVSETNSGSDKTPMEEAPAISEEDLLETKAEDSIATEVEVGTQLETTDNFEANETQEEPSLTLEEVTEIDTSAQALEKMQKNRRLELSQPENQGIKKVEFPKSSVDINKTLG